MEEIGYRAWSLIPLDTDPTSGSPSFFRPPMLTAVALDRGASLVFQFAAPPGGMRIAVEVTALTAEGRSRRLFQLFTGSTEDSFHPVPHPGWEKSQEGMYTSFSTRAGDIETLLKINFDEAVPLVVNQVHFTH